MLKSRALRGAAWTIGARLAGRIVDFVTLVLLARFLSPSDFGLTTLATSIIIVVEMMLEIPIITALMRLPQIDDKHLDTAFTLGLARGTIVGVVLIILAWPFVLLYQEPRLLALLIFLTLAPVARSIYSPRIIDYYRDLNFESYITVDLTGKVVAAFLSVISLYLGFGYWAIATHTVMSSLLPTVFSYFRAPYKPKISLEKFSDFASFIGWFTPAQLVSALSWQFDRAFLGYFIDRGVLGQYAIASNLAALPIQSIIAPAMSPMMAAFARFSDDRARLKLSVLKATQLTIAISAPIGLGISQTSDLLSSLLFGEHWIGSSKYLSILGLTIVLGSYGQPLTNLAFSLNRPRLNFQLSLVDLGFKCAAIPVGYAYFGAVGVAYACVLSSLIIFVVSLYFIDELVSTTLLEQIINLKQVTISSAAMFTCVVFLRHLTAGAFVPIVELFLVSTVGAVIYLSFSVYFGMLPAFGRAK